jgi:hypothetical protein
VILQTTDGHGFTLISLPGEPPSAEGPEPVERAEGPEPVERAEGPVIDPEPVEGSLPKALSLSKGRTVRQSDSPTAHRPPPAH